jgi:hypothetical protein
VFIICAKGHGIGGVIGCVEQCCESSLSDVLVRTSVGSTGTGTNAEEKTPDGSYVGGLIGHCNTSEKIDISDTKVRGYIKGYEYVIKVEKTHLVNPPMDASSVRYKLKEIVSQEFRISEGYTMHDDVLFYWETWDGDKGSYRELELSIIEDEHFIIIKEAEKGNAVDYLAEKGFSVMENSTDDPSKFLSHNGVKDCIQMTVKGTGNLDELPGSVYVAPLYYYVFSEPQSIIGRTNLLTVWFECQGNEDFFKRNIAWIQAYGEILGLITISTKEYFDHTDQSCWGYVSFAVTNQSAGNVVEIHNWFQEAARYEITDVKFPELASEPDND